MANVSWQQFLANNLGKVLGVALGLLLGWMIIEYGMLKTLFVFVLVAVGYFFGKKADDGEDLRDFVRRMFRGY
ncbi:MAG: DUF2273 domain-containing protein [Bacillota bacterium]